MSSSESAIQFHKPRTFPTSSQHYKSSVKCHESRLCKTHARELKCQDIPDERSKVTWVKVSMREREELYKQTCLYGTEPLTPEIKLCLIFTPL